MNKYCKSFSFPAPVSNRHQSEGGNALIYVLIIIALFAALSFVLARQGGTSETSRLSEEKIELYATNILQTAAQIQTAMDQSYYTGTEIGEMDFILPSDAAFNTAPNINKVFHPEGGGVTLPRLPGEAINEVNTDPVPGWYLGRFMNVEWTESEYTDVILTAHQLSEAVCEEINRKITGSPAIPVMGGDNKTFLIDESLHSGSNPAPTTPPNPPAAPTSKFLATDCPNCEGHPQICVTDGSIYSFYSIVAQR